MIDLSEETQALARRLAQAKRVGVDALVRGALEDKARAEGLRFVEDRPRKGSAQARAARLARFEEIAQAAAALPVIDARATQDIIDDLNAL